MRFHEWLCDKLIRNVVNRRAPDFVVGGFDDPYLHRWYLTPWSKYDRQNPPFWSQVTRRLLPNVYLHKFLRSDDDRALHDHPWFNVSFLLQGSYIEETIRAGGVKVRTRRDAGALKLRSPWASHRVELLQVLTKYNGDRDGGPITLENVEAEMRDQPCWTLFMTSPRVREWGFHCPDAGWVMWKNFVSGAADGNNIGKGCNQ